MIEVGTKVRSLDGLFTGRVLGRHGIGSGQGGASEYRSLPENLNVRVYTVLDDATGEIRSFAAHGIEAVED